MTLDLTGYETVLPYGSPGWAYLNIPKTDTTDRSSPGWDDSSWPVAAWGRFGSTDGAAATAVPTNGLWQWGGAVWIRQALAGGADYAMNLGVDDTAKVYWNGTLIWETAGGGANNAGATAYVYEPFEVPPEVVTGFNVIAVRGEDWNQNCLLDVEVYARATAVRQWPRDDADGLGAAPRIYPPPRSQRLVGGYQ